MGLKIDIELCKWYRKKKQHTMPQKGTLPLTGQVTVAIDDPRLELLRSGLITEIRMEGIFSFPHDTSLSHKKVRLCIVHAHPPGGHVANSVVRNSQSDFLSVETVNGIARGMRYLTDKVFIPRSWLLFGFLDGEKKIPIIIVYCPLFQFGVYSFKREEEKLAAFNPQLN